MGRADAVRRNRELQRRFYGEPLGDRLRRLLGALDVSQTVLAVALGVSSPMLSQLMSGRRVKIGSPAVLGRLLLLEQRVAAGDAGSGPEAVARLLTEVRDGGAPQRLRPPAHRRRTGGARRGRGDARSRVPVAGRAAPPGRRRGMSRAGSTGAAGPQQPVSGSSVHWVTNRLAAVRGGRAAGGPGVPVPRERATSPDELVVAGAADRHGTDGTEGVPPPWH